MREPRIANAEPPAAPSSRVPDLAAFSVRLNFTGNFGGSTSRHYRLNGVEQTPVQFTIYSPLRYIPGCVNKANRSELPCFGYFRRGRDEVL